MILKNANNRIILLRKITITQNTTVINETVMEVKSPSLTPLNFTLPRNIHNNINYYKLNNRLRPVYMSKIQLTVRLKSITGLSIAYALCKVTESLYRDWLYNVYVRKLRR